MDDLLKLLLSEFDVDVPLVQSAHDAVVADPAQAGARLPDALDFLSRSAQASQLAGLEGFAQWLMCISQCVEEAMQEPDADMTRWLSGWIARARAYLERPAQPDTVAMLTGFLQACPNDEVGSAAGLLEELLSIPPSFEDGDVVTEPDVVTEADVSLATEDADPGLLSAMLVDAPEQLERLRGYVGALNRNAATPESLIEAQRIAHTLKGSGNIVGIIGVGRTSHYLENVMEWALQCVRDGVPVNALATRDMSVAIETLQQMVGHLLGEERAPAHALAVLTRLSAWSFAIQTHEAHEFAPEPLTLEVSNESGDTDEALPAGETGAAAAAAGQSVRVDLDRLSRVLRRAGQSLYVSQRMNQLLAQTRIELSNALTKQRELEARLREMQGYVDRQVVNLRAQRDAGGEFDALEMDRYDAMFSLSRFITEDVRDQYEHSNEAYKALEQAQDVLRDEQAQLTVQHRDLMSARMLPVKTLVPRLRRNVQQTAATTGKMVELVVTGEQTLIDTNVLTRLTEPLLHLVRNAIDHGVETPEARERTGKSPIGTVHIDVRVVGQEIELNCSDDGGGLDAYAVHQKAIEYGLVSDNDPLTPDQIYNLILLPGFSTKSEVTEVSGRGVGLDVVNDRVVAMKGRIDIQSAPGEGTTFSLRVPQSLGAAHVVVVAVGDERAAVPVETVELALAGDQFTIEGAQLRFDDAVMPVIDLALQLGLHDDGAGKKVGARSALITHVKGQRVALLVDAIVDSREVILQDAGALLRRVPGVMAATLREDGHPMLILDVAGLVTNLTSRTATANMRRRAAAERTRLMVVDDALSVRRAMTQLFTDAGYEVVACKDGQEAIDRLRDRVPAMVLTDLEMPLVNGVELTRRIRENPQWNALPVAMITSRASDKHRQVAEEAGVDVFLTKPFSDTDLLAHVRSFTRKAPSTASVE